MKINKLNEKDQLKKLMEICNMIYIARNIALSQEGVVKQLEVIDTLFCETNEEYYDMLDDDALENTKWAKKFLKECPTQYEEALTYVKNSDMKVCIYHNNETGDWVYSIVVMGSDTIGGFWLDTFDTKQEALDLIKEMGWQLDGVTKYGWGEVEVINEEDLEVFVDLKIATDVTEL